MSKPNLAQSDFLRWWPFQGPVGGSAVVHGWTQLRHHRLQSRSLPQSTVSVSNNVSLLRSLSSIFHPDDLYHLLHQVANWRVPGEARPRRKVSRFRIHRLSNGDHHIILHCMDPCNKDNGPAICNSLQVTILESCFNSQPHWIDGKEVDIEELFCMLDKGSEGAADVLAGC